MLKRAVVYLRVSTAKQAHRNGEAEGYSLPAQRQACAQRADNLGAVIVEEYIDAGNSARSADRPQLQAMLERLRSKRDIDYVIVHKVDRMARNVGDDVAINLTIRQAGAQLVSVSEAIDETPGGMLLHTIMAGVAEFYSNNLGHEARKGMAQKALRGGTPGYAPLGYLNTTVRVDGHEVKTVIIDPERGHHIAWAFQAYASQKYSLNDLVDELAARGMVSRPTVTRAPTPLTSSQLHRILSSPYYIGKVLHKGVTYDGKHEPLIDEETWQRVQAVRLSRRIAGDRSWRQGHHLMGSLWCARCGQRLGYSKSTGKNGERYGYFFCLGRNKKRNDCQLPYLPADKVEMMVTRHWFNQVFDEATIAKVKQRATAFLELRQTQTQHVVAEQTKRLKALERTKTKLIDAYLSDAIPVDELKRRQDQVATEIADANRQLGEAQADVALMMERLDLALRLLGSCGLLYKQSPDEARRSLNQAVFTKLLVDVDGIEDAERTPPFARLHEQRQAHILEAKANGTPQEGPGTPLGTYHRTSQSFEKQRTDRTCDRISTFELMAERVGFEPTVPVAQYTAFRERHLQPLRHLSSSKYCLGFHLAWRHIPAYALLILFKNQTAALRFNFWL